MPVICFTDKVTRTGEYAEIDLGRMRETNSPEGVAGEKRTNHSAAPDQHPADGQPSQQHVIFSRKFL
jgi:hypothetical protein